jgi:NAD dependent epimerase/dehydratase
VKVFLTGADGFIGSHLAETLVRDGHTVTALAIYNSIGLEGWLAPLPKEIRSELNVIHGDVRDAEQVADGVKGNDWVLHLAALIGIPYSYDAPRSYVDTNITGTLNVLEASKRSDVAKVLVTSTSEVYGSAIHVPIDESHPKQPQSPYSATKIAADALAISYWHAFDLPVTVARPFNTYGPRQSLRAVIPTIMLQLLSGKRTLELGNLDATRDFTFVTDTARGLALLAESDRAVGREVNLASGKEISVRDLAYLIATTLNMDPEDISFAGVSDRLRPKKSEVDRLMGDSSLARELLDWDPQIDLAFGLTQTANWLQSTSREYQSAYNSERSFLK